jgi:hypothetical protein
MLSAGTVPQRGGMRMCSVHPKGDCLDPVIARITQGQPYRHAIGFEANEQARAEKDRLYDNAIRAGWYPLQGWGWSRADCQRFLVDLIGVTFPKACPSPRAMLSCVLPILAHTRRAPAAALICGAARHVTTRGHFTNSSHVKRNSELHAA